MNIFQQAWKSFVQGPIYVILFGLIFFGIGAGLSYKYFTLQLHGVEAQGRVVSLDQSCDDDGCSYAPVVSFQTRDGMAKNYYSTYYSGPPAYDIGESVTLIYDPQNPADAAIKGEGNLFRIIFMSVGGVIMSFGIYVFIKNLVNPPSPE